MNLRDWLDDNGLLKDGTRIAWGESPVTWTVSIKMSCQYIVHDETCDVLHIAVCASLPSAGWRVLP